MAPAIQTGRAIAAATLAALTAGCGAVLFGAALPVGVELVWFGRRQAEAVAHGGAILFATVPLAAFLGVLALPVAALLFYEKLTRR